MMLLLRSLLIAIPRFLAIIGVLTALQYLDVSPLPEWTLIAFAYLLHFVLTFLSAKWAFGKRLPRWQDALTVALVFIVFGTALEAGLFQLIQYMFLTRADFRDLTKNYSWQSLYIVALYVIAVFAAAYYTKRHHVKEHLPEGLEG
jgi:Kef-type K+ transport system membrane component KefB